MPEEKLFALVQHFEDDDSYCAGIFTSKATAKANALKYHDEEIDGDFESLWTAPPHDNHLWYELEEHVIDL